VTWAEKWRALSALASLLWRRVCLQRHSGLAGMTIPAHAPAMDPVTERLRNFLQYVAVKLIDDPSQAQLKVAELAPKKLRFKLVLGSQDVAMLIGRNGFTASAIRNVLKAAAEKEGVQVSLQIHSHEEEAELLAREGGA
jgi:predicted RNA-binding protein YlqC (UPF0109 family)